MKNLHSITLSVFFELMCGINKKVMKKFFLFYVLLFFSYFSFSDELNVVHSINLRMGHFINEDRLSYHWAQELIGSDLLKKELKKIPPPNIEDWIAVFDTAEFSDGHDIYVKNLISDEGMHAVLPDLPNNQITVHEMWNNQIIGYEVFRNRDVKYDMSQGYRQALSMYERNYPWDYLSFDKKKPSHYINNSMDWETNQDIYNAFSSAAKIFKPIVVVVAGNYFPTEVDDLKTQASKDLDMILVGSLSPNGLVSNFSQSDEEVAILAPSDVFLTSATENGECKKFGGTSGAAPLVTGSLAGFEWISGYSPTAKEAKILLEKTAFPTLHSYEKPRLNGVGMLNSYKLGMVGKKLKQKCQWEPLQIHDCFKGEILNDENYHFPKDEGLETELKRVFPTCAPEEIENVFNPPSYEEKEEICFKMEQNNCLNPDLVLLDHLACVYKSDYKEKEEVFQRLRKAVLLNPDPALMEYLACIYKSMGFIENAIGLENLSLALQPKVERDLTIKSTIKRYGKDIPIGLFRAVLGMGGFEEDITLSKSTIELATIRGHALPFLKRAYESGNIELQKKALYSASFLGEQGLPLLERAYESGNIELQEYASDLLTVTFKKR